MFVRRLPGVGAHVELIGHEQLSTFAKDAETAREDLRRVLERLLTRDAEFARSLAVLPRVRARRFDVVVRARQGRRIIAVPMRFTALLHGRSGDGPSAVARERRPAPRSFVLRLPRLEIVEEYEREEDLESLVEQLVQAKLGLSESSTLLGHGAEQEETVETLTLTFRPEHPPEASGQRSSAGPRGPSEAARDLVADARASALDRAFCRDREMLGLIASVTGPRRASTVLLGPSGVGKTALVHEFAHRIALAERSDPLRDAQLWSTSEDRIVAGMRYLGEWQARVERLLDALHGAPAVLHVENVMSLLTGARGGVDIARYLLGAMDSGELVVLCEATPEELTRAEREHPAFVRALRPLRVEPLDTPSSNTAIRAIASRMTRGHRLHFNDDSLVAARGLCEGFGDGTPMPGAAVGLLRATVAAAKTGADAHASAEEPAASAVRAIRPDDVIRAFCERTGYPRALVDPSAQLDPDEVLAQLRARVLGQDAALVLLRDLVVTLKAAMADPSRPLGSFLFLGPTGVGKTESALSLAAYLFGDPGRVARFDMGEFAAPGSAARLVSDRHGAQGSLTRRVREQPFGVVLLDEIEKADPGVHDLLLQLLGEGRLTDGTGRAVSFRNTVVILTSNLGADSTRPPPGFGARSAETGEHYLRAVRQFFRPELVQRIDHVVPFAPLDEGTVLALTERAMREALAREGLARRGVSVRYDRAVLDALARLGFEPRYGARPLKRAIERWVVGPIARLLAARGSGHPSEVTLVARGDGVALAPSSASEVPSMTAEHARDELLRRANAQGAGDCTLAFVPLTEDARARAAWLCDGYARWCEGHEATVTRAGPDRLRVRGALASILRVEQGVCEFEEPDGVLRVRVRVERIHPEDPARPEAVMERPARSSESESHDAGIRLFTTTPEPAAWDFVTEIERPGPWESALEPDALDRFALARLLAEA